MKLISHSHSPAGAAHGRVDQLKVYTDHSFHERLEFSSHGATRCLNVDINQGRADVALTFLAGAGISESLGAVQLTRNGEPIQLELRQREPYVEYGASVAVAPGDALLLSVRGMRGAKELLILRDYKIVEKVDPDEIERCAFRRGEAIEYPNIFREAEIDRVNPMQGFVLRRLAVLETNLAEQVVERHLDRTNSAMSEEQRYAAFKEELAGLREVAALCVTLKDAFHAVCQLPLHRNAPVWVYQESFGGLLPAPAGVRPPPLADVRSVFDSLVERDERADPAFCSETSEAHGRFLRTLTQLERRPEIAALFDRQTAVLGHLEGERTIRFLAADDQLGAKKISTIVNDCFRVDPKDPFVLSRGMISRQISAEMIFQYIKDGASVLIHRSSTETGATETDGVLIYYPPRALPKEVLLRGTPRGKRAGFVDILAVTPGARGRNVAGELLDAVTAHLQRTEAEGHFGKIVPTNYPSLSLQASRGAVRDRGPSYTATNAAGRTLSWESWYTSVLPTQYQPPRTDNGVQEALLQRAKRLQAADSWD